MGDRKQNHSTDHQPNATGTMMIHKRILQKWIHEFILVMCQLHDEQFRFDVHSGKGLLFVPVDIFETFKRRNIVEFNVQMDFHFILFSCDSGQTIVKVKPLTTLEKGIILTTVSND